MSSSGRVGDRSRGPRARSSQATRSAAPSARATNGTAQGTGEAGCQEDPFAVAIDEMRAHVVRRGPGCEELVDLPADLGSGLRRGVGDRQALAVGTAQLARERIGSFARRRLGGPGEQQRTGRRDDQEGADGRRTEPAPHRLDAVRIAPRRSAMTCLAERAELLVADDPIRPDEEGLWRPGDAVLDRQAPAVVDDVRVAGVPVPCQERLGIRWRVLVQHADDHQVLAVELVRGGEHRMLVDAGGDAPAGPEVDHVRPAGEVSVLESVSPSSVASVHAGAGWPMRGDATSRGSRPKPVKRSQPSGMTRSGTSSQRSDAHPQAALHRGVTGRRQPCGCSTPPRRPRAARARSRTPSPMPTIAPPIQIQTTSGFTNRCSVTVPVAGSEASSVTYRSSQRGAHRRRGDGGRRVRVVAQRGPERAVLRPRVRDLGSRLDDPRVAGECFDDEAVVPDLVAADGRGLAGSKRHRAIRREPGRDRDRDRHDQDADVHRVAAVSAPVARRQAPGRRGGILPVAASAGPGSAHDLLDHDRADEDGQAQRAERSPGAEPERECGSGHQHREDERQREPLADRRPRRGAPRAAPDRRP